jgi:outer membrane protein assembly factor BamA
MRPLALGNTILIAMLALAAPARSAPQLEYRGMVLTPHQVDAMAQSALRAPGDSLILAQTLGAVVEKLEEMGHLDARAHGGWESGARLVIEVREGPRYRLGAIVIAAGASADSARFAAGLGLHRGDPAAPRAVAAAIERALTNVVDHGFPYAELGVSRWQADSGLVALRLDGTLGPQVTVTRARIEGLKVTRESVALRSMGRLAGLPYQRDAALAGRDRLMQLGLFRSVSFEGLEGEGDWSKAQLVYKVDEPRYNQVEGAFGVQGQGGTVGLAKLDLGNLLGTGRALSLAWQSQGQGRTDFGARYIEPLVLGAPLRVELRLDQQMRDSLYDRTRWGGSLQLLRSAAEKIEAGYDQERVVQPSGPVQEANLQSTSFSVERSTLEPLLAPRRGSRLMLIATETFKREVLRPIGTQSSSESALEAHGEWTRALVGATTLGLEGGAGGKFGTERILPVYDRYAIGGAATLRGYDEEEFHVDRFALSRLELRRLLGRAQRVFLFWDHAWMQTRLPIDLTSDRIDTMQRDGIGFGMRLETAGGVVGIDYGLEPGRAPVEGKIHLRLVSAF